MSVQLHRQAEALMAEAELLVNAGRLDDAKSCWLDAGLLEAEVFAQIPRNRGKTRGIIAVSAVALLRDAGALDEASQLRRDYLENGDLPEAWRSELEALAIHGESDRAIL